MVMRETIYSPFTLIFSSSFTKICVLGYKEYIGTAFNEIVSAQ
jgi:hypothetical protein